MHDLPNQIYTFVYVDLYLIKIPVTTVYKVDENIGFISLTLFPGEPVRVSVSVGVVLADCSFFSILPRGRKSDVDYSTQLLTYIRLCVNLDGVVVDQFNYTYKSFNQILTLCLSLNSTLLLPLIRYTHARSSSSAFLLITRVFSFFQGFQQDPQIQEIRQHYLQQRMGLTQPPSSSQSDSSSEVNNVCVIAACACECVSVSSPLFV